jgi:hypothetical protein
MTRLIRHPNRIDRRYRAWTGVSGLGFALLTIERREIHEGQLDLVMKSAVVLMVSIGEPIATLFAWLLESRMRSQPISHGRPLRRCLPNPL